mmetsp:Transcript_80782/g.142323  ORF Transcript_80782/g.142323 Transcript_80782/m.142323 type:complete len:83 (+) Transcript_80782:259-507(+)
MSQTHVPAEIPQSHCMRPTPATGTAKCSGGLTHAWRLKRVCMCTRRWDPRTFTTYRHSSLHPHRQKAQRWLLFTLDIQIRAR